MQRLITMLTVLISLSSSTLFATEMRGVEDSAHTRVMYMLHCQGCHSPDGKGSVDRVPNMKNYLGNFLKIAGGREFLVQVPGSANAPLDDKELAQLLNWMLTSFSADVLPEQWQAYTEKEVTSYRSSVLTEVVDHRAKLVNKIEKL